MLRTMLRSLLDRRQRRPPRLAAPDSPPDAAERHFATVFATVQAIGLALDRAGRITYANDFLLRLTGWQREEVLGRSWFQLFVDPGLGLEAAYRHALAEDRIFPHLENEILTRAGARRLIAWDNVVLRGPYDCAVGVACIGRDVTDERASHAVLGRSEAVARHLISAIPQLVWTCGPDGGCTYLSPQWLAYTGRTAESSLGYGWHDVVHADDLAALIAAWSGSIEAGQAFDTEARLRAGDGSYRWFKQRAVPVRDEAGRLEQWFGTSTDVTDVIDARETLRAAGDALRLADRRKDEFLATLAHELRNPLAPMRTSVTILERSDDAHTRSEAQATISRQLGQMVRLVDDLLDVSRITAGKLKLHREPIRLQDVLQRAVESAMPKIELLGHRLQVDVPLEPVPLSADVVRLSQVITNLLNNAAKFSPRGTTITLHASCPAPDRVRIAVRDGGIGITAEALPRIFDLFTQSAPEHDLPHGGLGIGLAVARRLVELHGGEIHAQSAGRGRGSTFTIELPRQAVAEPVRAAPAEPRGERRCHVVVADDNRDAADSLATMLRLSGHEVQVAYDGRAALELSEAQRPNVILLDIGMPRLDGYEVARELRRRPWAHELVIAALTGWGQEDDRRKAAAAGFDHHFTKPVDPDEVEAMLARLVHCAPAHA